MIGAGIVIFSIGRIYNYGNTPFTGQLYINNEKLPDNWDVLIVLLFNGVFINRVENTLRYNYFRVNGKAVLARVYFSD